MRSTARTTKNLRFGDTYRGTVHFTSRPSMALVPDTRVYYVRDATDYDLYRMNNNWYLVQNGRWYQATTWEGPFVYVRTNMVPREVRTIPSGYRRGWNEASAGTGRAVATTVGSRYRGTALHFTSPPSMAIVPDTRVYYLRDESDVDLYRYGNRWYYVENGTWYRSPSWNGPFTQIRIVTVPREVLTIPSGYRRNWVPPGSSY